MAGAVFEHCHAGADHSQCRDVRNGALRISIKAERGFEGGDGPGTLAGGSGSRSFYLEDPDGNRIELYTDMMKVPDGEQFPRRSDEDLVERVQTEGASTTAAPR